MHKIKTIPLLICFIMVRGIPAKLKHSSNIPILELPPGDLDLLEKSPRQKDVPQNLQLFQPANQYWQQYKTELEISRMSDAAVSVHLECLSSMIKHGLLHRDQLSEISGQVISVLHALRCFAPFYGEVVGNLKAYIPGLKIKPCVSETLDLIRLLEEPNPRAINPNDPNHLKSYYRDIKSRTVDALRDFQRDKYVSLICIIHELDCLRQCLPDLYRTVISEISQTKRISELNASLDQDRTVHKFRQHIYSWQA